MGVKGDTQNFILFLEGNGGIVNGEGGMKVGLAIVRSKEGDAGLVWCNGAGFGGGPGGDEV